MAFSLSSLLPFNKSIDKLTGTLDTFVTESTLDRDKQIELQTAINLAKEDTEKLKIELEGKLAEFDARELEYRYKLLELKEKSHQIALESKTTPFVDALHKLSRPIDAKLAIIVPVLGLIALKWMGVEMTGQDVIMGLGVGGVAGGGVAGLYSWQKGKGAEIK